MTGGCLCGGVRFELAGEPGPAYYCHCTRCQRRSGTAASVQMRVDASNLTISDEDELVRAYNHGDGWDKLFCSRCGSALFARNPADPEKMSIRLGAFDEDPGATPVGRNFTDYAAAWEPIPDDGLPRYPERFGG